MPLDLACPRPRRGRGTGRPGPRGSRRGTATWRTTMPAPWSRSPGPRPAPPAPCPPPIRSALSRPAADTNRAQAPCGARYGEADAPAHRPRHQLLEDRDPLDLRARLRADASTTRRRPASDEFTLEDVQELHSTSRLHMLPPFRWRLAEVPLKLDDPYWIEAPEFDLDFHLREIALAPPGRRPSARRAGRADRGAPARPLAAAVGAVRDPRAARAGTWACLTKMHHAAIDGVSGAEIMGIAARHHAAAARGGAAADRTGSPRARPAIVEMLARGVASAGDDAAADPAHCAAHAAEPRRRAGHGQRAGRRHALARSRADRAARRGGDGELLERPEADGAAHVAERDDLAAPALRLRLGLRSPTSRRSRTPSD